MPLTALLQKFNILEADAPAATPASSGSAQPVPNTPVTASAPMGAVVATDPGLEQKVADRLNAAIEQANMPGIDFFEFMKALKNMEAALPGADDRTRYSAAFAALSAQGADPNVIVTTAQHYIDTLATKEREFADYIQQQVSAQVEAKLTEAAGFETEIANKGAQIQKLTQEIAELTQARVDAVNAANTAKVNLENYASIFTNTKNRIVASIQTTAQRFREYLMPAATK